MKKILLIILLLSSSTIHVNANDFEKVFWTIVASKIEADFQLSYENNSLDNTMAHGEGLSFRTRLGLYTSTIVYPIGLGIQWQNVSHLIENFNDSRGNGVMRDMIMDPQGSRFQKAYLNFDNVLKLGRQTIDIDDSRFGASDCGCWRLNEHVFEGFHLTSGDVIDNLMFEASYIKKVNTMLLTDVSLNHLILLKLKYSMENHNISLYGNLLDTKGQVRMAHERDNYTVGLRVDGIHDKLLYEAALFVQDDYKQGSGHNSHMIQSFLGYDIDYAILGLGYSKYSGSKDGTDYSFDTLYAKMHPVNGWADQFMMLNGGMVSNGLENLYVQFQTFFKDKTKITAKYHIFDTTENHTYTGKYGNEFNLEVKHSFDDNFSVTCKYALYDAKNQAGNPTSDKQVLWIRLNYSFLKNSF